MKPHFFRCVLVTLCGGITHQVMAQSLPLAAIVVTATRNPQRIDDTLTQTAVITRADIESANAESLTALLQALAGVEIRATGGRGQPAGVFIRGATAQQTLVLVDGVRVGSASSGGAAFENIALDLIERIEVVKGPLSGLYGSDAVGGVVQIFTRTHAKPRLTASLGAGNNAAVSASAGLTTVEDKTAITLNVGYQSVKPGSASNNAAPAFVFNPDNDPYANTNFLAKISHTLWQGETLSASAWQSRGRTRFDAGPGDDARNTQTLSGLQLASHNQLATFWKSQLRIAQSTDDIAIRAEFGGTFKTTQSQLQWQNDFATPIGTWVLGLEQLTQKLASDTPYEQTKRTTDSVFLGVTESRGEIRLTSNVRLDRDPQFGARTTGALSYGVQMAPDELIYFSYGEAFRAPSFNDLYYPGAGNRALLPEKSRNSEFGWRLTRKDYQLNLAVFNNVISDLIAFTDNLPRNTRRARILGFELAANTTVAGIRLRAAGTFQRPEDVASQKQLPARAKAFATVSAARDVGAWNFNGMLVSSAARFDSASEAEASKTAGYATLDLNARYQINKLWSLNAALHNAAGKKYQLSQGYDAAGRTLMLTARLLAF